MPDSCNSLRHIHSISQIFGHAYGAYGGLILGLSQFTLMPQYVSMPVSVPFVALSRNGLS